MARELPNLGDFELQVLQLVWDHEPCMERQISDLVRQQRPVSRTTVLKTMQRLEAKGLLVSRAVWNADFSISRPESAFWIRLLSPSPRSYGANGRASARRSITRPWKQIYLCPSARRPELNPSFRPFWCHFGRWPLGPVDDVQSQG